MVNKSGGRLSSDIRSSTLSKFLPKKLSPYSITAYIIIIFGLSIFIFFFYTRDNLEDEQKPLWFEESQSQQMLDKQHLWDAPFSYGLHPCVKPTSRYQGASDWDRFITVRSNGGLNQMRTGISDMVAVARIMNATLVIPRLDKLSFWQDSSIFSDIFDEIHFITSLRGDVKIVKELPKELESVPRARKHFTSWSSMSYYEEMTRLWKEYQVVSVAKSDSRLANNDLPLDIQRLRCRALYHALRFSPPIENLAKNRSWWSS